MQKIVGKMEYEDLEGGVWLIVTEAGQRLVVNNLPEEFQVAGLKVELTGEEEASFGIAMMGNTFYVQQARRL
ncbi:hypothetical protein IJT17_05065 [bacterium]|nr:hypothetical protein [bacterium]